MARHWSVDRWPCGFGVRRARRARQGCAARRRFKAHWSTRSSTGDAQWPRRSAVPPNRAKPHHKRGHSAMAPPRPSHGSSATKPWLFTAPSPRNCRITQRRFARCSIIVLRMTPFPLSPSTQLRAWSMGGAFGFVRPPARGQCSACYVCPSLRLVPHKMRCGRNAIHRARRTALPIGLEPHGGDNLRFPKASHRNHSMSSLSDNLPFLVRRHCLSNHRNASSLTNCCGGRNVQALVALYCTFRLAFRCYS